MKFEVWTDEWKRFDSGIMTGASATRTVTVDVAGVQEMRLIVRDGGDGFNNDHADWAGARLVPPDPTPPTDDRYLSDLVPLSAQNGWGPIERDLSNGESGAGDGRTIRLDGASYVKGLGVHARSDVLYSLGGQYAEFLATVGVDDEVGTQGSVSFEVYADGQKVFDSGRMTASSPAQPVQVSVAGKQQLRLVVTDAGDGFANDHADWADARIVVSPAPPPPPGPQPPGRPVYLSRLAPVSASNGWGPIELDRSNGDAAPDDGRPLMIRGTGYAFGLGVHANSEVVYNLGGAYARFVSDVGVDREMGGNGSVTFQVWGDDTLLWDSGIVTGTSGARNVNVDVTGRQQLRLVVTDAGDSNRNDHADWADARLWTAPVPAQGAGVNVTIDTTASRQVIEGFGAGVRYADGSTATDAYQDLFARDLGASVVRMVLPYDNIINAPVVFGPDIQDNIAKFGWDYFTTSTSGDVAAGLRARLGSDLRLFGSLWSPPAWMKTNNSVYGGGHLKQDDYTLEQFARYLAAYVKGFEQHFGVPFYAVSIQNEPRFTEPYQSCVYTPEEWVRTIKAVGREFERWGITTKLMGPEDVGWRRGDIADAVRSYADAVAADPEANRYVSLWTTHGFHGHGEQEERRDNWADSYQYFNALGRPMWMTEGSGEEEDWSYTPSWGTEWGAIAVALRIHDALVYGNVNSYVYLQFADPTTESAFTSGIDPFTAKFSAARQYFKFIRPGAVRVAATPDSATALQVSAYRHDANRTLTSVLINRSTSAVTTTITLDDSVNVASFLAYRTSANERFVSLPGVSVQDGRVTLTLPAMSVTTLYGAFTHAG